MIHFVNVSKKYNNDITALENVSFEIKEGEFLFLIGPSGSGKTTIIKLLIREENPSDGYIYFDEDDITRYNRSQIYKLRRKVGVIFQDYKLLDDKTAFENISFVMEAAGQNNKTIKDTVPYLLDIVGLADRQTAFPKELSGGEKQRVAIARALANNPKLLIADEPTGNLDPEAAWDIVQILKKINDWGTTVIMSTHGSDIVNELSKRVIKMDKGILVRDEVGIYNPIKEQEKKNFEDKIILTTQPEIEVVETPLPDIKIEIIKNEDVDIESELPEKDIEETTNEKPEEVVKAKDEKKKVKNDTKEEKKDKEIKKDKQESKEEENKKESKKTEKKENEKEEVKEIKAESKQAPKAEKPKLKISLVGNKRSKEIPAEPQTKNNNSLSELGIDNPTAKILKDSGYDSAEELIIAGINSIENIKELSKDQIEQIRESLAKYINQSIK